MQLLKDRSQHVLNFHTTVQNNNSHTTLYCCMFVNCANFIQLKVSLSNYAAMHGNRNTRLISDD